MENQPDAIDQPLHIKVRKSMLDKGLKSQRIQKELKMGRSLVSMALTGKRVAALERIAEFVDAYPANGSSSRKAPREKQATQ
jgi:hypothetical protein